MSKQTAPVAQALDWLRRHGADGMFDKNGVLLASGDLAPFMRSTWNALRDLGLVEFYNPTPGKGRGRVRLTQRALSLSDPRRRVAGKSLET
ncbi:MAG: hypothetical protein EPO23_03360 [Xanthobacteraceae bacterium]|nr:MAG: hypothetical protein EPO23_03360 [Xanthobacteraceae bacterium]